MGGGQICVTSFMNISFVKYKKMSTGIIWRFLPNLFFNKILHYFYIESCTYQKNTGKRNRNKNKLNMNHEQLNTSGRFSSVFWSYSINIFIPTLLFKGIYSGDLNSKLIRYSDKVDLFAHQMVPYSDARYHGSWVFRSQF